jgi:hypothetical protein
MHTAIALNAVVVALIAYATTSFLIAPAAAVMTASMFAMHPRVGRVPVLASGFILATLAPFLAGLLGLLPEHVSIRDGAFTLTASHGSLDATATYVGLTIFVTVCIFLGVGLARAIAVDRERDQHALRLQSWQLRQLVPRS